MFIYEHETYSEYYYDLESRMQQCKQEFLERLSSIVHPNYIEPFASALTYAYNEGHEDAMNISEKLKLTEFNFLAFLDKSEEFERLLQKEENDKLLDYVNFDEEKQYDCNY